MKKGLTELVFVLDRSGSMSGLERDTIGGFNAMLKKQRKEEGEARITTVLFDDVYEKIHDRIPLSQLRDLSEKDYYVRGMTALLDAIGHSIRQMIEVQRHLVEEERAEKVIFVITTDGLENASRQYSRREIRHMIEFEKESYGWEFLFLGANMDAISEAESIGIGADRSVTFENDSQGIETNYRVLSETIGQMRRHPDKFLGAGWKKEIEDDVKARQPERQK